MNELMIVDKIGKELEKPRKEKVFPLTPTHRKELRELKRQNIGNLRDRLSTIKNIKREEYQKKYGKELEKELKQKEKICKDLNNDWNRIINKINLIIGNREELEEKTDLSNLSLFSDYNSISRLEPFKSKREFKIQYKDVSMSILKEEFNNKYGNAFDLVSKKIDDLSTKYEEAINFGDLEIVKRLYFIMKKSEVLFEKINKLEI